MLIRIPRYEHFTNYKDFNPGTETLYSSNATSGTQTTLTDTLANWVIDQWKDKIVKIKREGGIDFEFAVVETNTSNTLIFDDTLIFIPCELCTYEILVTFVVEPYFLPLIVAVNLTTNNCGILLPKSTKQIERQSFHAYVERSLNGDNICPIMCKGLDRQAGVKYGTLEHQSEGVRLYAHQWVVQHWDIIQTYNIKRLAAAYFSLDELITTANNVWGVSGNENVLIYDKKKRFAERVREGKVWSIYTSLLVRDFRITIDTTIKKTGGGQGEFYVSLAKRDGVTGAVTFFNTEGRFAGTKFGGVDGIESIAVKIPISLKRNDEIAIATMRTSSTMTIAEGSTIDLIEF